MFLTISSINFNCIWENQFSDFVHLLLHRITSIGNAYPTEIYRLKYVEVDSWRLFSMSLVYYVVHISIVILCCHWSIFYGMQKLCSSMFPTKKKKVEGVKLRQLNNHKSVDINRSFLKIIQKSSWDVQWYLSGSNDEIIHCWTKVFVHPQKTHASPSIS